MKKILKINSDNPGEKVIKKAVEELKNGKVIIYPTDTVYGLGANALDEKAVRKVFEIKKRDFKKPISIIVRDLEMAKKVASFDKDTEKILKKIFPGPVTAILYKKKILPDILTGGSNKVGIRIPDCKFTQALMQELDFPITTTSANISGEPIKGQASTVIDLTEKEPRILRAGPVTKNELKEIFKNL
jgi:L-threonylcarbamoyladenylate synthase